ncbi:MAG: mechanosensitive ion channel [Azospirillum sp.]|nr:mechanosensitive ion channel [Azospirillum sp.]
MPPQPRSGKLRKLLIPLFFCGAIGAALYYGGSAFHSIGVAAFDTASQILAYALGFGEILFLAVFVQRLVQYVVLDGLVASALGTPTPRLLSQLWALIVFVVGAAAVAGIVFKQDLTVLWAASGIVGFVFGIALRDMILDIFTGLAINIDRPVKIGDSVLLHKAGEYQIEGKVLEISWRSTRIQDLYRNIVVIPNSKLAASVITNYSTPQNFLRAPMIITLDPEIAPDRAIRILEAAATEGGQGFVGPDAPAPVAWVKEITTHGVEYMLNFFPSLETRVRGRSAVLSQVLLHLARAGIRPAVARYQRLDGDLPVATRTAPEVGHIALMLAGTELFGGLDPDDLALLAEGGRMRAAAAGTVLAQAGESAVAALLVVEGLLGAGTGRAADGSVDLVGPGSLVGAEALFTGDGYPRTLRARTAVLVAELDLALVRRLLERKPTLAAVLSARLAGLLHRQLAAGSGRRLTLSEGELAADILASLRRSFADLKLP